MCVSRTLWLGQDAVCSGAFQISNTTREIPNMWKSRAGSAVGWFSFKNGTLIGKLQSSNFSTEGQVSLQGQAKKSRPNDWFPCWESKRQVLLPFLFVHVSVSCPDVQSCSEIKLIP